MHKVYNVKSLEDTQRVALEFVELLTPGTVVVFQGELGAGKTTFIQYLCRTFGVQEYVNSPTFTLVNEYLSGKHKINHIDFYRLNSEEDLREIGIEQYLNEQDLTFIEWGNKFPALLPQLFYYVKIVHDEDDRIITIHKIKKGETIE